MSVYSEEIGFATGDLIGFRTDVAAAGVTPVKFGILQDVQVAFTADLKELYGQGRYCLALAPGKTKIEVTANFAGLRGRLLNDLYFGATTTATQTLFASSEAGTVPGSSTYIITVANAATFLKDCGVYYQLTGQPLQKVASVAAVGQYSVVEATGVYTFYSGDASAAMYISYTYGSTGGVQIPIGNQKMGQGPTFRIVLSQPFDGRQGNLILNNCQSSKLSLPTRQDDFTIASLDFMACADAGGNIGSMNLSL